MWTCWPVECEMQMNLATEWLMLAWAGRGLVAFSRFKLGIQPHNINNKQSDTTERFKIGYYGRNIWWDKLHLNTKVWVDALTCFLFVTILFHFAKHHFEFIRDKCRIFPTPIFLCYQTLSTEFINTEDQSESSSILTLILLDYYQDFHNLRI